MEKVHGRFFYFFLSRDYFHTCILFFGNNHTPDGSVFWGLFFQSCKMLFRIFNAVAKPCVNRKLQHIVSVVKQKPSKRRGKISFCFCGNGQIKKYDYSHKLTHIDACKSARFSGAVIRTSPTLSNFSDFAPQVRRHRTMRKSAR